MTIPTHRYNTRSKGYDPVTQTLQTSKKSRDPEVQWLASNALATLKEENPAEGADLATWSKNHWVALTGASGVIGGILALFVEDNIKEAWSHLKLYGQYKFFNQATYGSNPQQTCESWGLLKYGCQYTHKITSLHEEAHWSFTRGYGNWVAAATILLAGCAGVRYLHRKITG